MRILKVDLIKIGNGVIYNQITKTNTKVRHFAKNFNSYQIFITFIPLYSSSSSTMNKRLW